MGAISMCLHRSFLAWRAHKEAQIRWRYNTHQWNMEHIMFCYRMKSKVWLVCSLKLERSLILVLSGLLHLNNVVKLMYDAIFLDCSRVFARGSCVCLPSRPWGSWLMLQKPLPQMPMWVLVTHAVCIPATGTSTFHWLYFEVIIHSIAEVSVR